MARERVVRESGEESTELTDHSCEKLRHLAKHGAGYLASESRTAPLFLKVKSARIEYHPLGVIGIIIPWNYPFHNVLR